MQSSAASETCTLIEYSEYGMWEYTFYALDHSGSQPFNYNYTPVYGGEGGGGVVGKLKGTIYLVMERGGETEQKHTASLVTRFV